MNDRCKMSDELIDIWTIWRESMLQLPAKHEDGFHPDGKELPVVARIALENGNWSASIIKQGSLAEVQGIVSNVHPGARQYCSRHGTQVTIWITTKDNKSEVEAISTFHDEEFIAERTKELTFELLPVSQRIKEKNRMAEIYRGIWDCGIWTTKRNASNHNRFVLQTRDWSQ